MFYVYILYSISHNRYYIGQTNDVGERLVRPNSGYEKSTSPFKPWELILALSKPTRAEAMALEKKLKNLNSEDLKSSLLSIGFRRLGRNLP